jgi:peptidoglycan hydrolase-like protein with peptidoglycan-binding domain
MQLHFLLASAAAIGLLISAPDSVAHGGGGHSGSRDMFNSGRIDNVMGPETRGAIRSFQAHQGLPVTGQIDNGLINAWRR